MESDSSDQPRRDGELTDFDRALERALNEVVRALYEFTVLRRLTESFSGVLHDEDFFGIAHDALFNDMIARAARLFDRRPESVSLRYICNRRMKDIEAFWKGISHLDEFEQISEALVHVGDKTHFPMDMNGVIDTKSVWRSADIEPEFLKKCLSIAYETLNHVFRLDRHFSFPWKPDTYTGEEIRYYIGTLKDKGYLL